MKAPLPPGATLGILGGGQLGRMFALEARRMGYKVVTLEPSPGSPCGQVADLQIEADYKDESALRLLAEKSDVITYEFENIDAGAVEFLERLGKPVRPGSRALKISQDRLLEKNFIRSAGLGVTAFREVASAADLPLAAKEAGFPGFLKTVRGGYDGKGQAPIADMAQAEVAFAKMYQGRPLIWERKVPFLKELSVVACRGLDGAVKAYPVAENVHVHNILDVSLVPGRVSEAAAREALRAAEAVGQGLDIVGTFCVELFLVAGPSGAADTILVNEIAPRPHNSGHYTLDACACSQFEQQVRAICGLPLGASDPLKPSVMVNLLGEGTGDSLEGTADLLRVPELTFHLYGKAKAAAKRKMGHFTVLGATVEEALAKAESARKLLKWK